MRRARHFFLMLFLVTFYVFNAHADSPGTLTKDSVNLNLRGVSPYVEKLPTGDDRLYFPSEDASPDNILIMDCKDSGGCTRQKAGSPFGADPTIVTLKDGTRRVFFVEHSGATRTIKFATLSSDGLSYSDVKDLGVEDSSISDKRGWGVPDAVVKPDGNVQVFWVNMDLTSKNPEEFIVSATSTDATATKFSRDPGIRIRGYVDSKVLLAKPGNWIMILATGPGHPIQNLFLAYSQNGMDWNVNSTPLTDNSESAFDPTGYFLNDNIWRIYYASAPPGQGEKGPWVLKRATLVVNSNQGNSQNSGNGSNGSGNNSSSQTQTPTAGNPSSAPSATPSQTPAVTTSPSMVASPSTAVATVKPTLAPKPTTITCVKGKVTKKITGLNPKCPTGYSKK